MNVAHAANLALVLLLCMPAVVGTLGLWALGADVLPERPANLVGAWAVPLFLMASYGPILVIVASVPVIVMSRQAKYGKVVYLAWAAICAGLLAAAGFWQWGIHTAPTP